MTSVFECDDIHKHEQYQRDDKARMYNYLIGMGYVDRSYNKAWLQRDDNTRDI